MKCNHCSASLRPTAKLCIQCGNAVSAAPEPASSPAFTPALAEVSVARTSTESSQATAPAQEHSAPGAAPASTSVQEEPAPQMADTSAVALHAESPIQSPVAAPAIVAAPVAQTSAKYEVAPEFALPPQTTANPAPATASLSSTRQAPTSSKSGVKIAGGGLGVLVAGAVAYFALAGGSKAPAPDAAPAPVQVAASAEAPAAPVAPAAPTAVVARTVDKAFINDMLQLVNQDQWSALADLVRNAQAQANPDAQVLAEQAQSALGNRNHAQAQKLTLELLLTDPQSGSAWFLASQVFAVQDITQPAQSALKLAYYFAKDRAQALNSLGEFARAAEPKFKAVATQISPQLQAIPAHKP